MEQSNNGNEEKRYENWAVENSASYSVPGNGMGYNVPGNGVDNSFGGKDIVRHIIEVGDERRDEKTDVAQNNKAPIMDQNGERRDKEYQDLVKEITPTHSLPIQMFHAFWTGGLVCVLGQFIINVAMQMGADDKTAGSWCSLLLVLLSVLLTGFNIFGCIAKYAGAGILVPITGFANGVASAAIEYQKEGQVFGIGCKIFTIAGPVILYGLMSSWVLGLLYWIGTLTGARM